jgi:uncharacterized protein (DUF1697 family)
MTTYVALLRGINVGGNNKVPMADLRPLVESLGYSDVRTYIQSGNVVFKSRPKLTAHALESAITERFGLAITVVLRTSDALAQAIHAMPFPAVEAKSVHVGFMANRPEPARVAGLDAAPFLPEEFAIIGSEVFLHLPTGMARTKLPSYLDRQLKVATTLRNWATVTKLAELCAS